MATAAPGGDSHILREYLVALGFRVDQQSRRNFSGTLERLDKGAARLGRTLVGVGVTAGIMAVAFTRSMERMFYNARYADTTVARLQNLEFAGRNIGLAGGQMTQGVKSFASALRSNPGLLGMLEKLGVPVKGREGRMDQVMMDFVRATKSMPPYIAQQFAEMFGIDPEMLFNLQKGEEQMTAAMARREQMLKDMGVDSDKLAKDMVDYANQWRDLTEHATIFGQAIAQDVKPFVDQLITNTHMLLDDWKKITDDIKNLGAGQFWTRLGEGLTGHAGGTRAVLTPEMQRRIGAARPDPPSLFGRAFGVGKKSQAEEAAIDAVQEATPKGPVSTDAIRRALAAQKGAAAADAGDTSPGGVDQPGFDPQDRLRALEKRYGLPPGMLDRVWAAESSRGANMLSPKGARGHFGFMPKTQKEFGLKDPDDFVESSEAAARKLGGLMKMFKGDTRKVAAAYNWGEGNVMKYGLGGAPAETRGYMDKVAGQEVNVNTEVNIHGVSDPARAGEAVVRAQQGVASGVMRNMSPKVR